jgi:hypothetical protein
MPFDLLPCPFCGGDVSDLPTQHKSDCYFLVEARGAGDAELFSAWNTRAGVLSDSVENNE